jgi:hypothetical protein
MQILSMYVITDKQKDVSHDVIMVIRWTVFQHNFIKMDYAWNIIVFFVFNRRYKLFMVNEVRQFTSVFILFKEKKHDFMYILWINKEQVDFLFINNEHVGVLFIDTKSTSTPLNFDIQTRKITNNRINTTKFNNVINKINTIITTTTIRLRIYK